MACIPSQRQSTRVVTQRTEEAEELHGNLALEAEVPRLELEGAHGLARQREGAELPGR